VNFTRIAVLVDERVCNIVLNRPEKRNALDDLMVTELQTAFQKAGEDPSVKVVHLSARGPAFSAGADLEYLRRLSSFDLEQNRADSLQLARLFETIYFLGKPVIAVVNGPALAGGCGLASVCDFVLASEEHARFGYTEVRIGFVPAIVMTFLLRRVGEGRARELALRGNIITAAEALNIGLVSRVVPEQSLEQAVRDLTGELLSQNSLTAMGLCKSLIASIVGNDVRSTLAHAAQVNAEARMTPECRKGIEAFLQKKEIRW
jgi:methylglutaconyl-CoA hydratase